MPRLNKILISRTRLMMQTRSRTKQFGNYGGIIHIEADQEFQLKFDDNLATVQYNKSGKVLDLVESFVPPSARGKGIGRLLAKETFDYIDQNKYKMKVTCSFLKKVYEENKETYKHLLAE